MRNTRIELTETKLTKKPNTKNAFEVVEESTKVITNENYNNIICDDTVKFFRRLGGSETLTRGYFYCGYLTYRLVSTSPDRENKTVREFNFIRDNRYK